MATTIKWIDNNAIETAHRIYKSSTHFTKDNLPAPLVELGPDITEYVDSAGIDGENWYIVSALLNDYEVFSEPFIAGLTTAYINDVFDDGSAIATYQFDGDATDLGGNYNGVWSGTESYTDGVIGRAASFDGSGSYLDVIGINTTTSTISCWLKADSWNFLEGLFSFYSFFTYGEYVAIFDTPDGTGSLKEYNFNQQLPVNVFFHLCIVITNNIPTLYVNSVDMNITQTGSNSWSSVRVDGRIGAERTSTFKSFDIDQLRIFNRALTQAEVDILYQEGADFL